MRILTTLFFIAATLVAANAEPVSVGIYTGPGVFGAGPGALATTFGKASDKYTTTIFGQKAFQESDLAEFDVLIFPGGSGSKQAAGIEEAGREKIRKFIADGGIYVGICGGCYLACENFSWSLGVLDAKTKSSRWKRGRKELELGYAPEGLAILDGIETSIEVKYVNGPVMEPAGSPDIPDYTPLAVFKTEVAENDTPKGIQVDSPAILTGTFGEGRVIGISPHPEQTEGLESIVPKLIEWALERQ